MRPKASRALYVRDGYASVVPGVSVAEGRLVAPSPSRCCCGGGVSSGVSMVEAAAAYGDSDGSGRGASAGARPSGAAGASNDASDRRRPGSPARGRSCRLWRGWPKP